MNTFFKKILPVILIIVIFSVSFQITNANGTVNPKIESTGKGGDTYCSAWSASSWFTNCLLIGVDYILEMILKISVWGITFAGGILNIVIKVQNGAFQDQPMVNIGWKIARDVVNIFYILFLLIISIATILGISSYSMKQLLWKLLLSALLVNFSLPLGGIIIDTSNALGNSFYLNMGTPVAGTTDRDLAKTFVKGFQTQKAYQNNPDASGLPTGTTASLINLAISYIIGIILVCITVFTMLAACFLLVARIVILWIVLILSPFACLFMVLPRTVSIANKLFETLFNQSFFYPAYMFMLFIVFKAIDGGVITKFFKDADTDPTIMNALKDSSLGSTTTLSASPYLILSGVTLGVFLIAALVVAKSMGAYGAGAAMAYGQKAARSAQSYAGDRAGHWGSRLANRTLGSAPVAATLGRIPLISRGITSAIQKGEKAKNQRADIELKKMQNLDPRAQARALATISSKGQAAWFNKSDEKRRSDVAKNIKSTMPKGLADKISKNIYTETKNTSSDPDKLDAPTAFRAQSMGIHEAMRMYYPDHAGEDYEPNHPDSLEGKIYAGHLEEMMGKFTPDQKADVYKNQFNGDANENRYVRDYFMKKEGNFDKFTKNREDANSVNSWIKTIAKDHGAKPEEISNILRNQYKNPNLADQFDASPAIRTQLREAQEELNAKQEKTKAIDEKLTIVKAKLDTEKDLEVRATLKIDQAQLEELKIKSLAGERKTSDRVENLHSKEAAPKIGAQVLLKEDFIVPVSPREAKSKLEEVVEQLDRDIKNQQSNNSGSGNNGEKKS